MMVAIIDYGCGNLFSISQGVSKVGGSVEMVSDPDAVNRAERIILPGVGAFGRAMDCLRDAELVEPILQAADRGIPILGICLGMELLATESFEFGHHRGLNLIPGRVIELPAPAAGPDETRIPCVGWRPIRIQGDSAVPLDGLGDGAMYYFNHSFGFVTDDGASTAATVTVNGLTVAAVVRSQSVMGFQFHPEKSGTGGLDLIEAFLNYQPAFDFST